MNLKEVFCAMHRDGLIVSLTSDDRLKITGKALTDEQRNFIRRLKPDIMAELRLQAFVDLVRVTGACEHGILLDRDDIAAQLDAADIAELVKTDRTGQNAWASALAMRAVRYRGKVPAGWNKTAICARCGPVYSFHGLDTLSCSWCELRLAGKWFPVPGRERWPGMIGQLFGKDK